MGRWGAGLEGRIVVSERATSGEARETFWDIGRDHVFKNQMLWSRTSHKSWRTAAAGNYGQAVDTSASGTRPAGFVLVVNL